ncbi:MAG: hypothetical protein JWO02_2554, partial [Solirubrobacterales bacterium]|nr:hypothetical protein [Solirubrobacterales bacterium]
MGCGVSAAQLGAGLSAACAVLAAWEAIGLAQAAQLTRRLGLVLAPLRVADRAGQDVTTAVRRRLIALLAATLLCAGWLVGGVWPALAASTAGP